MKMKINWQQKLSSRKFWAALIGFVTAVLIAFNVNPLTVEQVAAVISAMAMLMVYIFTEGNIDAKRAAAQKETDDPGMAALKGGACSVGRRCSLSPYEQKKDDAFGGGNPGE